MKSIKKIKKLFSKEKDFELLNLFKKFISEDFKTIEKLLMVKQHEISRLHSPPLLIGQITEKISKYRGIVNSTNGNSYFVKIISTLDMEKLEINTAVALHRYTNILVYIFEEGVDLDLTKISSRKKPKVDYSEIGGLESQKEEIIETIEYPIKNRNLYEKIGINLPKGVLLYGPPGTGKTMLVKAVALRTTAFFLKASGSEFVQKYLGEGPKMVRDLFKMAKINSPSIIFVDEIDAIASKRFDAKTGADREVQRILIEFLNQMDGFDENPDVKVIMCTNRIDSLDPAILRPGRIDRKIGFPLPDTREKRFIFQKLTSNMNLSEEIDLEDFVLRSEKLSGAVISAICQEAGMQALRKNRFVITSNDFEHAYKLNILTENPILEFYK